MVKTDKEFKDEEISFKKYLDSCPKVPIIIPEDQNNPDDVMSVSLNGVVYAIPRGIQFEVPKPIYDVWKYSYDMTMKANKKMREQMGHKEITVM